MIKTNRDLAIAVNQAIEDSGYKKVYIAQQLNMTKQGLASLLNKQNFSLDDANKILDIIGFRLDGLRVIKINLLK